MFLKGWGANFVAESRLAKTVPSDKIKNLDSIADLAGLSAVGWAQRYSLDAALVGIHRQEEIYWQQHCRLNWTLKVEALTA